MSWVAGMRFHPKDLERAFFSERRPRVIDGLASATLMRWRLYAEEGLAGKGTELWLLERTLTVEHTGDPSRLGLFAFPRRHGRPHPGGAQVREGGYVREPGTKRRRLPTTLRRMANKSYPSDLTDHAWDLLEPHLPAPKRRGRPRLHSPREILNAVFYVLKSGCPWRLLPRDFPNSFSTQLGE